MKKLLLSALMVLMVAVSVNAQEETKETKEKDYSEWQARFRFLGVIPNEHATIEAIGGDVDITTSFIPELDFSYFFNENIALELILGTTRHDVEAIHTAAGDIDLGNVSLLPPTLTLQYHFTGGKVKPYIGAGVNYTIFYDVDTPRLIDDVEYDNTMGFAAQFGIDFDLNNSDKWFFNIDLKKLFLKTDVTVDATTALGAVVVSDTKIEPWIIGIGFGRRF